MNDFQYTGGVDIDSIENRKMMRFSTAYAKDIVIALDKSGIPFSAKYGDTEMMLTYDGSYREQVDEIIRKAQTGKYEVLLRELKENNFPDSYLKLLPEVAEILHTTIGTLRARPSEIQEAFCKTYADFWLCDTYTIQRELDRIATLNIEALQAMQESVQTDKTLEIRQKQKLEQLARDTARVGFSRETQQKCSKRKSSPNRKNRLKQKNWKGRKGYEEVCYHHKRCTYSNCSGNRYHRETQEVR